MLTNYIGTCIASEDARPVSVGDDETRASAWRSPREPDAACHEDSANHLLSALCTLIS